jgi:Calx-beta domain-containing protein/Big-like domain-containing protein
LLLTVLLALFALPAMARAATPGKAVVFANPDFVDFEDPPVSGAEANNTIASLQSFGEDVTTFTDITAAGFTAAVAGRDSLVIPEQEEDCVDPALDDAARTVIKNFVAGGGQLVLHYSDSCVTDLVNHTFGFSIVPDDTFGGPDTVLARGSSVGSTSKTPQAANTEFQNGADSIPNNNATTAVLESSLPAGALSIYSDGAGGATVVDIPFGDGSITLLGWDWFFSTPPNTTPEEPPVAPLQQRGGGGPFDGGWQLLFKDSVQLADVNVADVSVTEGNSGTTPAVFGVSTPDPHSENIKAQFATADGGAKAGSDYTAAAGTVTIPRFTPGTGVTVNVIGDKTVEPDETFSLNLSGPFPAVLKRGSAIGTIRNDDAAAPKVAVAGVRRACVAKSANVRFTINAAAGIARVRVTLDGKRVVSTTKSRFTVKVNARKLKSGRHRIVAVVTDKAGNRTTVRRSVTVCAAAKPRRHTGPRFTG